MANAPGAEPPVELLDNRKKWLILFSLMSALFIGALDQTIVSTATPTILSDLGGFDLLPWLFTSYMLASTVVVPLTGKLSDIYGRKPFLLVGMGVFMVGSALCGAAPNMEALIAFRVVQGLGGGMIFASVFATVGDLFPPSERGKYIGLFTATFSLASIIGPTLGGFITDTLGWRWIFYINLPVGAVAIPAVWLNLPWKRGTRRPKIDWTGAVVLTVASVSLLIGLVWAGNDYAWGSPQVVSCFVIAALFLAWFIWQESRHPEPIVPLHLFRNRIFLVANLIVFFLGVGLFGAIAYLPTFIQTALGISATASGIISTPQSLGVLVASIVSGQLITRTGRYKIQAIVGSMLFTISMVLLTTVSLGTEKWELVVFMVILGVGFGLVLPTMSLVVQNAVSYEYLGVASSSSQFFRQIGGVFGTAIFGVILATSFTNAFAEELPPEAAEQIPAPILEQFEDPTLGLNEPAFAAVQAEILALPNGEELLEQTVNAQKEAIAVATSHIFVGASIVAFFCLFLAFFLKEVPLRQTIGAGPPGPQPSGSGGPPPTAAAPLAAPESTSAGGGAGSG